MALKPFLLLVCLAFTSTAADVLSLAGEWRIHRNAGGHESTQNCTFTQSGAELGGTCTTAGGSAKMTGKVEGKKVTWTVKTERDGSPLTIIYNGTVDSSSKIAGTVTAVEFGIDGDFTATRATP